MSELANCPFCGGGRPVCQIIRDGYEVGCRDCCAKGSPEFHGHTSLPSAKDRAIAAWNRRAPPATPTERPTRPRKDLDHSLVEELVEALRPFAEAARDADDDTVSDSSHAWESSLAMAVTFGDFRTARTALARAE